MIQINDILSLIVVLLIIIFYLLNYYQRSKLLYLIRSFRYHFSNLLRLYNQDDLGLAKINYYHYFYVFLTFIIVLVVDAYIFVLNNYNEDGLIRFNLLQNIQYFDYLLYLVFIIRFLLIEYIIGQFIDNRLKLIFFKNFIISIIVSSLMFLNILVYYFNDFYEIQSLWYSLYFFIAIYIYFQFKNYLSYFFNKRLKEVMYFILYLCAFKLAPWIWLYSVWY